LKRILDILGYDIGVYGFAMNNYNSTRKIRPLAKIDTGGCKGEG
jgi:hypothetical protein